MFSWKLKNEKVSNIDRFPEYRIKLMPQLTWRDVSLA